MKIELIRATFDLIIRAGVHQLDFMKIELIRATFDSIIHGGENRLNSHSGENIHNGDTRTKIDSISSHHLCIRNLGTGLDLHTRSKHVHRGRCYFTGLMSFSFTSYCLLLSFFAVRLM